MFSSLAESTPRYRFWGCLRRLIPARIEEFQKGMAGREAGALPGHLLSGLDKERNQRAGR